MEMLCLQKFEFVREKLRTSRKEGVVALHKFVFEFEGDRLNRKRLREFTGFEYDEHDERCKQKLKYIEENLTPDDLLSICNVLGLSCKVEKIWLHIFRNLQSGTLLCAAAENDDNDDDESECGIDEISENGDDGDVMRSFDDVATNNVHFEYPQRVSRRNIGGDRSNHENNEKDEASSRGAATTKTFAETAQVSRFSINFRDIEDSVRQFDGDENTSVEVWLNEFEETAIMLGWDELQKFIFAKKSLRGLAKLFIQSERGITSWQKLKAALAEEFKSNVNSAQIHKQLCDKKMKAEENVQEYFLGMKELAIRGNIEENALMQYVIEGINDLNINKAVLYGAHNLKEFKEKIKVYETMRKNNKKSYEVKTEGKSAVKTEKDKFTCYNCGMKGHKSVDCKDKGKGTKCFQCKQFGHIAKNCTKNENKIEISNARRLYPKNNLMNKCVVIENMKFMALFDTGSKFNIITDIVYKSLNKPVLQQTNVCLVGFGERNSSNNIKPIGKFNTEIYIDDNVFKVNFLVVSERCMDIDVVLGEEFCLEADIHINRDGLLIKKHNVDNEELFPMMNVESNKNEVDIASIVKAI